MQVTRKQISTLQFTEEKGYAARKSGVETPHSQRKCRPKGRRYVNITPWQRREFTGLKTSHYKKMIQNPCSLAPSFDRRIQHRRTKILLLRLRTRN